MMAPGRDELKTRFAGRLRSANQPEFDTLRNEPLARHFHETDPQVNTLYGHRDQRRRRGRSMGARLLNMQQDPVI